MSILTAYTKFIQQALKYGFSLWGPSKTRQTTKYKTGDDGDLEKGYPASGARFVDNGDGTITDNATGLMWVKDSGAIGGDWGTAGNPSSKTWDDAIDLCNALDYAGHTDWRMPNRIELLSLIHHGKGAAPLMDENFFVMVSAEYWTSTTYSLITGECFFIDFIDATSNSKVKTGYKKTIPVRLGIPKD